MFKLQNFVFPNLRLNAPESMYVRTRPNAASLLSEGSVRFGSGGVASFDTFFNGLSVGVWKRYCSFSDLSFRIKGHGHFRLRFGLHREGYSQKWIWEMDCDFASEPERSFQLPFWADLSDGLLYLHVYACSDGEITEAAFETSSEPVTDVKLGIVITHFNRKKYVVPALARLHADLLSDPLFEDRITVIVVDNSKNITPDEAPGIVLLPNENLGGSGGFTRGLMYLEDSKNYTHCLFMDDDASCEIESITRTYALLSFSHQENFAVAGSLLRELERNRLFEKGACFDGLCHPLKNGLNLNLIPNLLIADRLDTRPDYGGWWFFAFALCDVKCYPFPFFVRGDDIAFGLMHKFEICTMNGINAWGDDFALKSGPLPLYLDMRNHILIQMAIMGTNRKATMQSIFNFFYSQLLSYNYASASAISLALSHLLEGGAFWEKNINLQEIRAHISQLTPKEDLKPISRSEFSTVKPRIKKLRRFDRILSKLSLNATLYPDFLLRKKTLILEKSFSANRSAIFKHRRVLYEYQPYGVGYVVELDRKRFFRELSHMVYLLLRLAISFERVKSDQQAALNKLTRRSFWEGVYAKELESVKSHAPSPLGTQS